MLRTYSNKNNIQNLNNIEPLRVEGTHKNESNEVTYLDQFNTKTIQMRSCTKKYIYIYIYIYVQIHTYLPIKRQP